MNSVIEVCKYLLEEGIEYVLTECFCQDPVQEYLETNGSWADVVIILSFAHLATDNTICIQSTTTGGRDKRRSWEQVTDMPLPS